VINNFNNDLLVDFQNVKYLLEIIKYSDAKVVATTSNKYSFQKYGGDGIGYYRYVKKLKEYGIEVLDVTPFCDLDRELEIMTYLQMHPEVSEFLILDDDYIINNLKEHQVFLDLYRGICEEHVEPSLRILNGELSFYPANFNFSETNEERILRINKYYSRKK
jgi:hypothetical protein